MEDLVLSRKKRKSETRIRWIFTQMLRLYPRLHRRDWGEPMTQLFLDQYREAVRQNRPWGRIALWTRVTHDILSSSLNEQLAVFKGAISMPLQVALGSRRRWIVIAAFLGTLLVAITASLLIPKHYSSTARVIINKDLEPGFALGAVRATSSSLDPYFLQTEFEVLTSPKVLRRVIEDLQLNRRWAEEMGLSGSLPVDETLNLLRKRLTVQNRRNTSLIEVRCQSTHRDEAAEVANAVVETYRRFRIETFEAQAQGGLTKLQEQLDRHSARAQSFQQELNNFRVKHNWIGDDDAEQSAWATANILIPKLEAQLLEGELSRIQAHATLHSLRTIEPQKLAQAVLTLQPDSLLSDLLSRRNQLEVEQALRTTDMGENHPETASIRMALSKTDAQVDQRISAIMAGFELKKVKAELERDELTRRLDAAKNQQIELSRIRAEYALLKRQFETENSMLDATRLKLAQEKVDAVVSARPPVSIVEQAMPASSPSARGVFLVLFAGTLLALIVSGIAAIWLAKRVNQIA